MEDKHQENGALTGPLIFTVPASSFIVILNFDQLNGTNPAAALPGEVAECVTDRGIRGQSDGLQGEGVGNPAGDENP